MRKKIIFIFSSSITWIQMIFCLSWMVLVNLPPPLPPEQARKTASKATPLKTIFFHSLIKDETHIFSKTTQVKSRTTWMKSATLLSTHTSPSSWSALIEAEAKMYKMLCTKFINAYKRLIVNYNRFETEQTVIYMQKY